MTEDLEDPILRGRPLVSQHQECQETKRQGLSLQQEPILFFENLVLAHSLAQSRRQVMIRGTNNTYMHKDLNKGTKKKWNHILEREL